MAGIILGQGLSFAYLIYLYILQLILKIDEILQQGALPVRVVRLERYLDVDVRFLLRNLGDLDLLERLVPSLPLRGLLLLLVLYEKLIHPPRGAPQHHQSLAESRHILDADIKCNLTLLALVHVERLELSLVVEDNLPLLVENPEIQRELEGQAPDNLLGLELPDRNLGALIEDDQEGRVERVEVLDPRPRLDLVFLHARAQVPDVEAASARDDQPHLLPEVEQAGPRLEVNLLGVLVFQ